MTQSRPNILRLTIIRLWLLVTLGLIFLFVMELIMNWIGINDFGLYVLILIILASLLGIFMELPEAVALTIVDDKIIVGNLLTGKENEILFTAIDEFKIQIHIEKYGGLNFTLMLIRKGNSHDAIELRYVANLAEIIQRLENQLPNSTEDEYGLLKLVMEQQTNRNR